MPLLLCSVLLAAQLTAAGPEVSLADREAETARLRALGLSVPDGGVVLAHPWDAPLESRSFVVPQAWFRMPAGDAGVRADALVQDLPVLRTVLERAYGGWDSAVKRGWDWDRWFSDWAASLERHGTATLPLAEAFAPMRALQDVQLDNHTTVPLGQSTMFGSGSQTASFVTAPVGPCTDFRNAAGAVSPLDPKDPAQQPRRVQRWDEAARRLLPATYLAVPSRRGTPAAARCGGAWVALTPAWPPPVTDPSGPRDGRRAAVVKALSGATEDVPALTHPSPTVALVRLPTFSKQNAARLEAALPTWPRPTGAERVLVVDLRDNGGGDAALEALKGWVDARRLTAGDGVPKRRAASCLYPALRWGYMTFSSRGMPAPLPAGMRAEFQEMLDAVLQPSTAGCPRSLHETGGSWNYRMHSMRPPGLVEGRRRILVLVNDGTGSDGEYMAMLLAALPESVIAGTNTFGVAQFIQPGYSVLPHTRLPFRVALGMSDVYGDGRSFDGHGLDVDVLLPTEASQSRDAILGLARVLADGK